eukprot:356827-Chlamydomonas_euryale.AAC.3
MGVCIGIPGSILPDWCGRADYLGDFVNQVRAQPAPAPQRTRTIQLLLNSSCQSVPAAETLEFSLNP